MEPTEREVYTRTITTYGDDCTRVAAYVGHGRTVTISTEGSRANIEMTFEPAEARDLAAALLKAADASESEV